MAKRPIKYQDLYKHARDLEAWAHKAKGTIAALSEQVGELNAGRDACEAENKRNRATIDKLLSARGTDGRVIVGLSILSAGSLLASVLLALGVL